MLIRFENLDVLSPNSIRHFGAWHEWFIYSSFSVTQYVFYNNSRTQKQHHDSVLISKWLANSFNQMKCAYMAFGTQKIETMKLFFRRNVLKDKTFSSEENRKFFIFVFISKMRTLQQIKAKISEKECTWVLDRQESSKKSLFESSTSELNTFSLFSFEIFVVTTKENFLYFFTLQTQTWNYSNSVIL